MRDISHFSFQHLGFVHCPIREHCPAFPHCTDAIVERTVSKRVSRPASWLVDTNHLNIILLGKTLDLNNPILPCNLCIDAILWFLPHHQRPCIQL